VSDGQRPGLLFVPIHWSGETASCARVGDLVSGATDPYSGQPEAKATPAAIEPVSFDLRGFARTHDPLTLPEGTWWARVALAGGTEYRLATNRGPLVWHDFAYRWLAHDARLAERLEGRSYRAASFLDGEMDACICVEPADQTTPWSALALTSADTPDGGALPVQTLNHDMAEAEPVICACFGVAVDAVRQAVASGEARTVADIGRTLRAGTNCGSCLPELKRIILHERVTQPG
jgi:assimilatory nitrate reductase catalytic subunit